MSNLFNKRSKTLFISTLLESIFALYFLCYFNYTDRMNYSDSLMYNTDDLALLFKNMYTSTWWALLILVISLIAIFKIISFIYKDLKYILISICLWTVLLILAIDIKDTFINILSIFLIFIPILAFNILALYNQKKLLTK